MYAYDTIHVHVCSFTGASTASSIVQPDVYMYIYVYTVLILMEHMIQFNIRN